MSCLSLEWFLQWVWCHSPMPAGYGRCPADQWNPGKWPLYFYQHRGVSGKLYRNNAELHSGCSRKVHNSRQAAARLLLPEAMVWQLQWLGLYKPHFWWGKKVYFLFCSSLNWMLIRFTMKVSSWDAPLLLSCVGSSFFQLLCFLSCYFYSFLLVYKVY